MKYFQKITILITLLVSMQVRAKYLTSEELRQKYPNISEYGHRQENTRILCPFWRMLERSGTLDLLDRAKNSDIVISISNIIDKANEFGCKKLGCGAVATAVSLGHKTYANVTKAFHVNITKLHLARGVAHECGLTFAKGGSVISEYIRDKTLRRLKEISDRNEVQGRLSKDDLMSVKLKRCQEQGVKITKPGEVEVGLIFSYLGGNDRGYVEYDDVVRFLHAQMPLTKSIDGI